MTPDEIAEIVKKTIQEETGKTLKPPVTISLLAAIPVATLIGWLWMGAGYAKDIDSHSEQLRETKSICVQLDKDNRQQDLTLKELKITLNSLSDSVKEIRDYVRQKGTL